MTPNSCAIRARASSPMCRPQPQKGEALVLNGITAAAPGYGLHGLPRPDLRGLGPGADAAAARRAISRASSTTCSTASERRWTPLMARCSPSRRDDLLSASAYLTSLSALTYALPSHGGERLRRIGELAARAASERSMSRRGRRDGRAAHVMPIGSEALRVSSKMSVALH